MDRDMDLIRQLLLEVEKGRTVFETLSDEHADILRAGRTGMSRDEGDKLQYHLGLLDDKGWLTGVNRTLGGAWYVQGLSWEAHDFLDSVRSEDVWERTKDNARAAGGFSVDILAALAKGFVRKKIEAHTGIEIDI